MVKVRSFRGDLVIIIRPAGRVILFVRARGSSTSSGEAAGDGCGPELGIRCCLQRPASEGPKPEPRSFPDPAVSIPFARCRVVPFSYQSYHSPKIQRRPSTRSDVLDEYSRPYDAYLRLSDGTCGLSARASCVNIITAATREPAERVSRAGTPAAKECFCWEWEVSRFDEVRHIILRQIYIRGL